MERSLRNKLETGAFLNVTAKRSAAMRAIKSKGNRSTELRFRMAIVRARVSGWILHPPHIIGSPDLFFADPGLAVFLDGCFWHGCRFCGHIPKTNSVFWGAKIEGNKKRDAKANSALKKKGIIVVRFWEHQIRDSLAECLNTLIRNRVSNTAAKSIS